MLWFGLIRFTKSTYLHVERNWICVRICLCSTGRGQRSAYRFPILTLDNLGQRSLFTGKLPSFQLAKLASIDLPHRPLGGQWSSLLVTEFFLLSLTAQFALGQFKVRFDH
jgi:hypothetical protein